MKTLLVFLCGLAALAPYATADDGMLAARYSVDLPIVVRGQTPTFRYDEPILGAPEPFGPPTATPPEVYPNGGTVSPFSGGTVGPLPQPPLTYDPFLVQPSDPAPFRPGFPGGVMLGANGPQPYRFGWTQRYDIGYLPESNVTGDLGEFEVFEFNAAMEYTEPQAAGWIGSIAPEFGLRTWEGPEGRPGFPVDLPGSVFHFGLDFELETPANAPYSVQLGFTPQINSDLERDLTSTAWYWDGRGIVLFRASPRLTIGVGALYWDRLHDRVLPYGGIIYVPDDRREYRIMFPESRASRFIGTPMGVPTWLYARAEYHVEAYEIFRERLGRQGEVELIDWRFLAGFRTDSGYVGSFAEAGWVLGRHVNFDTTPGFDVSSGFIARAGLRF